LPIFWKPWKQITKLVLKYFIGQAEKTASIIEAEFFTELISIRGKRVGGLYG
jgi:hypothetical protein